VSTASRHRKPTPLNPPDRCGICAAAATPRTLHLHSFADKHRPRAACRLPLPLRHIFRHFAVRRALCIRGTLPLSPRPPPPLSLSLSLSLRVRQLSEMGGDPVPAVILDGFCALLPYLMTTMGWAAPINECWVRYVIPPLPVCLPVCLVPTLVVRSTAGC
jgi:hypothetical protein